MRASRPNGRSPSTPSSPTWTPSRGCTSPAAACGRCPTHWPPPPTDAGVEFRYGATVSGLDRRGDRVRAVHTDTDERIEADAVVLTTELPDTYRLLGRTPRRLVPLRPSPSAVVAHVGCRSPGS